MDSFSIISNQLVAFLVMLVVGYVSTKFGIITERFLNELATLIMRILLPILIFSNAMHGTTREIVFSLWHIMVLAFLLYITIITVFKIVAKLLDLETNKGRVFQACFCFGNIGFLGLPMLVSIYPEHGAIYVVLLSIIDQLFIWTYGVYLTTPKERGTTFSFRYFLNPAVGAVVVSLILIMVNISLPEILEKPLLAIGWAATPLSLIYLGGLLYFSHWNRVLKSKELYVGIAIKMLILPTAFFFIASKFVSNLEMVQTMAIIVGLPSMVVSAMFAASQKNHGEYALGIVLVTTMFSLVTLGVVSKVIF